MGYRTRGKGYGMTDQHVLNFYGDIQGLHDLFDAVTSQDYAEVYVGPLFKNDRVFMRGNSRVVASTSADEGRVDQLSVTSSDRAVLTMLQLAFGGSTADRAIRRPSQKDPVCNIGAM